MRNAVFYFEYLCDPPLGVLNQICEKTLLTISSTLVPVRRLHSNQEHRHGNEDNNICMHCVHIPTQLHLKENEWQV